LIRHVVLFRFSPDSTAEQQEAMFTALRGLPARIPELLDYRVGLDAGLAEGNWDGVAVADCTDEAGWKAYMTDEEHQRIIAEHIRPIMTDRAAVQYEIS
jgi:Stress responsive A/B Barrel Domain